MPIRKVISRSVQDTTGVDILLDTAAPVYHSVDPSLILDFVNTKTMDPRVTFTRGSSATFYDGTSALAEQNLITYSQELNSWSKVLCSVTSNSTAAPDGTTTAETITQTVTNGEHYLGSAAGETCLANTEVTISIYAKNVDQNFIQFGISGNSGLFANFNLSTGAVGSSSEFRSTSIRGIGGGWYRCVGTVRPAATGFFFVSFIGSASAGRLAAYTPASATSVYLWGAQVEHRSAASAYTATSGTTISTFTPVLKTAGPSQPRFDVDPVTKESKGFLVEEQRTNVFTYSNLGDTSVLDSNYSVGANSRDLGAVIGPDGTLSARRLCSLAAGNSYFNRNANISIGSTGTYVFSIWARLIAGSTPTQLSGYFSSYAQGVTMNAAPSTNQWTRFYGTVTFTTTGTTNFTLPWYDSPNGTIIDYFGPQLEMGTFPTSYIPTPHGSSVTRAADLAELGGAGFANFFNNQAGTAYFEGSIFAVHPSSLQGAFAFTRDAGNDNVVDLRMQQPGYGNLHVTYGYGATQAQIAGGTTQAINTTAKFGIAYGLNDVAFYKNGVSIGTDNAALIPQNLTKLEIGKADQSQNKVLNGYVRKFSYYPVRLTNAEIVNLTT
jgi:hypothetical protein